MNQLGEDPVHVEKHVALYRLLLQAYPAGFRQEYGSLMLQLFRDDCRDALSLNGTGGLVTLWVDTCFDLVKSSINEHLRRGSRIPGRRFEMSESFTLRRGCPKRRAAPYAFKGTVIQ